MNARGRRFGPRAKNQLMLSAVVPALNAEAALPAALKSLEVWPGALEVIVADGGSTDATRAAAGRMGARVVASPQGRGAQLRAGAEAARGDWLLFLHADTVLAADWPAAARMLMDETADKAGYFRFRLDEKAENMERGAAWRARAFALPYGDQGLLISRALYDRVGGYRPLPLMEDVDIAGRLGYARLRPLGAYAVTSAARYRKSGYARRIARNLACLALYCFWVPAALINRLYR